MTRKGLGMTVVVDDDDRCSACSPTATCAARSIGRSMCTAPPCSEVMTSRCKSIGPRELAAEAAQLMELHRITALPVTDEQGRLIGALNVHDLMRAGVM